MRFKVAIVLLLLSYECSAAPVITGVSGTVADGATITITGSGFGAKTSGPPLIWDTFEGGTIGEQIQSKSAIVGSWETGAGSDVPKYSSSVVRRGSKSSYHSFRPATENASLAKNGTFTAFYLDFWVYSSYLTNQSRNWKPWRAYGDSDQMQFNYVHYCPGSGNSMTMYAAPCHTDANDWAGKNVVPNTWQHFQAFLKESDPNTANGIMRHYIDGGSPTTNLSNIMTRCNTNHFNEIRIGHYFATDALDSCPSNSGANVYIDDVYVDATLAHVEIGNAATYSGSTHREVFIPSAWGESITATVNTGTFSNGDTAYVYVFDAAGAVNSSGYQVTLGSGGGGDTTSPTLSSVGFSSGSLTLTSDESATCRYGTTSAAWASLVQMSTTGSTSHSQVISLPPGRIGKLYVRCQDASANESALASTDFGMTSTPMFLPVR